MRKLLAYLSAILLAASCATEFEQGGRNVDASLEDAPVTITFSVPDIPVLLATKSLEDGDGNITDTPFLDPEKMYLVVCGGSQSIKYIRKATLVNTQDNVEIPQEHFPFSEGDRITTLYTFSVQLELSDQPRTIHILGNVDENQLITGSYSYQSLPGLLSYDNKQAYWQKLYVPHIKAKIDPDTREPIMQNGSYVPDDETTSFFQYIPLIRNFAKIQVTNASENFQLHSYAVIFYPERGSVVPYRSNEPVAVNRFDFNPPSGYLFSGYEKSSFEQLEDDLNYPGNMPAGVALNDVVPPASEFEDPSTSNGRVLLYNENDSERGFYIYERGVPTDQIGSTFIIICGRFEDDDKWYYYRMDLMESKVEGGQTVSRYYPIYRNFCYNIQLHRISSEGVDSPEAAVNSSGAEDISADVSMRHLSDISNGTTRLVVEPFMKRTFSGPAEEGAYYELYARFFNNVNSDEPNMNTAAVRVELVPMKDGEDDILILYDGNGHRVPSRGYFFPEAATVGGVQGIRTIRFNTVEPLAETKTQKIRITGHKPGNPQDLRLYREVEITLQKKQLLKVTCESPVLLAAGTPLTVNITVPSELPESMFPLKFIVEPEDGTLTPNTSTDVNMPVVSGRSIATDESAFKDIPAFSYLRTLTWEEFSSLAVIEGERTFHCFFKTNKPNSATTVWVYNEYFTKASATFENEEPPARPTGHFYVKAIENCTVKLYYAGEYKIDDGEWIDYTANQSIPVAAGHKISFCAGNHASPAKSWNQGRFSCTGGKFEIGGNLASLMVGDYYVTEGSAVKGAYFLDFLKGNTNLVDAYDLEIPMLSVPENAYKSMFDSCTNLERGPQILPATSLGKTCYRNMFYNCAKLENAPVLAATKLGEGCYQRMFYGCTKINYIKMLGTQNYRYDAFFSDGTTNWCGGVASTGELWLDSALKPVTNYLSTWNRIVPEGWTVKYVGIDD